MRQPSFSTAKVLLLATHFVKGGAERQMALLADGISATGMSATHLGLANQEVPYVGAGPVRRSAGVESFRSFSMLSRFWKHCRDVKPTAVVSCIAVCNVLALLWKKTHPKVIWIMRESNTFDGRNDTPRLSPARWVGRYADVVVSNNAGGYRYWSERRKKKTVHIENILDVEVVESKSAEFSVNSPPYFLCVGRLERQKNFKVAIDAFARVVQNHPNVMLVFVGDGKDSARLKQIVHDRGIEKNVRFMGYQANPYPWMKRAIGVVLPSIFEGLPNVAMESLALRTPLLLSDISAHRDAFCDSVAFFSPVNDPNKLGASMVKLVMRREVSCDYESAREKYLSRWTPRFVSQQYAQLIADSE